MPVIATEQALGALVVVFPIEGVQQALRVRDQQHAPGRRVEAFGLKCSSVHRLLVPSLLSGRHCRAGSPTSLAEYGHERPSLATEGHVRKPLERARRAWHKPA